jgi:hypothetical protein
MSLEPSREPSIGKKKTQIRPRFNHMTLCAAPFGKGSDLPWCADREEESCPNLHKKFRKYHRLLQAHSRQLVDSSFSEPVATIVLKILVSVVRFRPGPPGTSFTQRPLLQVGVVVSGSRSPRLRSISGLASVTSSNPRMSTKRARNQRREQGSLFTGNELIRSCFDTETIHLIHSLREMNNAQRVAPGAQTQLGRQSERH